jgi:hypothetical protein
MTGLYYHRNSEDSLRMVTHADYGLKAEYVENYQARLSRFDNDIKIQIHIRNGGNQDYLVPEHHRIARLYQFDDAFIYDAMIGPDALVTDWRAEQLEISLYTALMRSYDGSMDSNDVAWCYGAQRLWATAGRQPKGGHPRRQRQLRRGRYQLRAGSTAFEYDDKGVLLGYRQYSGGERYIHSRTSVSWWSSRRATGRSLEWYEGTDLDIPRPVAISCTTAP